MPRYVREAIVEIATDQAIGHEILCRSPGGHWVEKDHYLMENLPRIPRAEGFLAVNLSTQTILSLPEETMQEAVKSGPLIIEWTEERSGDHSARLAASRLMKWRNRHGIRISLDDMGKGADSFERYLMVSPDIGKIDGNILHGARNSGAHLRAIEALANWCHQEGAKVVIEWIETPADLGLAKNMGIEYGQGFLWKSLSRPVEFVKQSAARPSRGKLASSV